MEKRKWTREEIFAFRDKSGSLFYFNPEDSNIFIPRRFGFGFSLNFANPVAIVLTALFAGYVIWTLFFRL